MSNGTLVCPAELDIANVVELHRQLSAREDDQAVVIDTSGVTKVDGAGLQLLLAYVRQLKAKQLKWSWSGRRDSLLHAAETLGLDVELGLREGET